MKRATTKVKDVSPVSPKRTDLVGVGLVVAAAILLVALATRDSGFLGQGLSVALSLIFGRGAWAVPVALIVVAATVWRGRRLAVTHVSYGAALLTLALLAALAFPKSETWFHPDALSAGGGYVGAIVASLANAALGVGAPILYFALAVVGLVLCVDVPLSDLVKRARDRGAQAIAAIPRPVKPTPEETPVLSDREAARARPKLSRRTEAPPEAAPEVAPADEPPLFLPPSDLVVKTAAPKPDAEKPESARPTKKEKAPRGEEAPALDASLATPVDGYQLPPMALLTEPPPTPKPDPAVAEQATATLEGTMKQFGIVAKVDTIAVGPTVTRYEMKIGPGIKVSRVAGLGENIAMDLAATQVRVEAPIPGKNAVGIEVPNPQPSMVALRELCASSEFLNHRSRLAFCLGKDVAGQNKYSDLTRMPHLLIGGATNSGKSIGLATLITSLLMRNTPKDLRLVMIDPKRVELTLFDNIPHLLCPVIKDVKEAAGVLRAVWREMDRRYDLFSEHGVRNIDGWNQQAVFADRLPYIVVIVDELADLMIQCRAEVETTIVRLAQLARAVGIHLVLATQRPSVDVITGLIKANIPSRIAFSVASQIDSRTILDTKGAENLIGKGDMLYNPIDANRAMRVQGCYVSEEEIAAVCRFWRDQQSPEYTIVPIYGDSEGDDEGGARESGEAEEATDPLWADAVKWAAERGEVSTSMLQRRFAIGFQRASRLIDTMEARGIVGRRDGPRPRDVLINLDEVDAILAGASALPHYDVGPTIGDGLEE